MKLQDKVALLNALTKQVDYIDVVGAVPSTINAAHGLAAEKADQTPEPLRTVILDQIKIAEDANQRIGTKTGLLETLRSAINKIVEQVKALPVDAEPVEPPAPPPSGPAPGAIAVNAVGTINGGIELRDKDGKGLSAQNGNYGCNMTHGSWYTIKAETDASVASMSSGGGAVALSVTDTPTDPAPQIMDGIGSMMEVAEERPVKAGQYVNMRIGRGGYSTTRSALFSLKQYAR